MTRLLDADKSILIVIDAQEKLMPAIDQSEMIAGNIVKLLTAGAHFHVPALLMAQYPEGLGLPLPAIRAAAGEAAVLIEKTCFSCTEANGFDAALAAASEPARSQLIITGAEAHVCVLQTVMDLLDQQHDVYVVVDGIGSRAALSHQTACQRMAAAGATLVTTEMVLFEWIGRSDSAAFKALRPLLV